MISYNMLDSSSKTQPLHVPEIPNTLQS